MTIGEVAEAWIAEHGKPPRNRAEHERYKEFALGYYAGRRRGAEQERRDIVRSLGGTPNS